MLIEEKLDEICIMLEHSLHISLTPLQETVV